MGLEIYGIRLYENKHRNLKGTAVSFAGILSAYGSIPTVGLKQSRGITIRRTQTRTKTRTQAIKEGNREINLSGAIKKYGMNLDEAGTFFGWENSYVTKSASDFTRPMLEKAGRSKEIIKDVAERYQRVGNLNPKNPSAASRAQQLNSLLSLFD